MPLYNGNYVAPVWVNGVPPTIGETELDIISEVLQGAQVLKGSGAPTSQTAGIVGQKYADTSTTPPTIYQCFGASGGVYTWGTAGNVNVNLAQEYDSSIPYAEGAYCLHLGLLYQANTAISSPEAWNSAHWTQVRAADALQAHVQDQNNPHKVTKTQIGLGAVDNVLQYSAENPAVKLGTVSLSAAWSGSGGVYTQTITVIGATVTENSYVELQFTAAQADTLAGLGAGDIYVNNNAGTLTAIAVGGRPSAMTVQCTVEETQIQAYLKFHGNNSFTLSTYYNVKLWNGTMESSTDASSWIVWDGTTTLSSGADNNLYLRGTGNTAIGAQSGALEGHGFSFGGAATKINCTGNIQTLTDYLAVSEGQTLSNAAYYSLFRGCSQLATAPALPATTLASGCYDSMFQECTQLTAAPALPATTLASGCYERMFSGCTRLTTAPVLPATTLAESCYERMFSGCTQLTTAPALPATTLAESCYERMFGDCTLLTTIPELPATTLVYSCYFYMFYNCSSIRLSESQGGEYVNPYRIPTSGTGTIAMGALQLMFNGTGGTFTGDPTINTTYYTSNTVIPAT